MKETVHAWLCQLPIIDQLRLDAFERRDGQERFCGPGSEACYYVHRRGHATLGVRQKSFVLVKGYEANTRFDGVAYNQGRTSRIPLCTEWRPRELLSVGELAIELESGLCEFGGIGDGCYAYSAILLLGLIDNILPISTAPAVEPAIIDRRTLGFCFWSDLLMRAGKPSGSVR